MTDDVRPELPERYMVHGFFDLFTSAQMEAYADEAVAAERLRLQAWRDAVDDALACCHLEVASDDPRESLRRLIDWHCMVQIDPAVSSAAQALIDRGAAEERERIAAALDAMHAENARSHNYYRHLALLLREGGL